MASLPVGSTDGDGQGAGRFVTQLNPHDILLGRGAPTAYYTGNVEFRELIKERKTEYIESECHQRKQDIAMQLYGEICKQNGRFLKEMPLSESVSQGLPPGEKYWCIVDEDIAVEKIKQALREKDAAERSVRRATSASRRSGVAARKAPPPQPPRGPVRFDNISAALPEQSPLERLFSSDPLNPNLPEQNRSTLWQSEQDRPDNLASTPASISRSQSITRLDPSTLATLLYHERPLGASNPNPVGVQDRDTLLSQSRADAIAMAWQQLQRDRNVELLSLASNPTFNANAMSRGAANPAPMDIAPEFTSQQASAPLSMRERAALSRQRQRLAEIYHQQHELVQQRDQLELQEQLFLLQQQQQHQQRERSNQLVPDAFLPLASNLDLHAALGLDGTNRTPSIPNSAAPGSVRHVPDASQILDRLTRDRALTDLQSRHSNIGRDIGNLSRPDPLATSDMNIALAARLWSGPNSQSTVDFGTFAPAAASASLPSSIRQGALGDFPLLVNDTMVESTPVAALRLPKALTSSDPRNSAALARIARQRFTHASVPQSSFPNPEHHRLILNSATSGSATHSTGRSTQSIAAVVAAADDPRSSAVRAPQSLPFAAHPNDDGDDSNDEEDEGLDRKPRARKRKAPQQNV